MNQDEQLDRILDQMPQVQVSEGFTDRTVRRVNASPRRGQLLRLAWVAGAGLLALAIAIPIWLHLDRADPKSQAREEFMALRAEHQQLSAELASLKMTQPQQPQLLYLGGTDSVDYVVDLRQMSQRSERLDIEEASF